jgi:hypothetical protein
MGSAQSEPARVTRDARAVRRRIERDFMRWGVQDMEAKSRPILNTQPVFKPALKIPRSMKGFRVRQRFLTD